jgi:hypothetical protein
MAKIGGRTRANQEQKGAHHGDAFGEKPVFCSEFSTIPTIQRELRQLPDFMPQNISNFAAVSGQRERRVL